ncbi:MAG: hypothetical protein ACI4VL_04200, partial [Bacilli bacterium]
YYQKVIATISVNTITKGLDYYINYAKGSDITGGTLTSSSTYTDGLNTSVTFYKKDNTYNIYGHIYLDVTNISSDLRSEPSFKYTVVSGSTVISSGHLQGISSGSSKQLAYNIPLSTASTDYTVYLWLDENELVNYELEGSTFTASIRCEATMKPIKGIYSGGVSFLGNLYSPNTTAVNNNITYNLDNINNLMEDTAGNIRYYGKSPNNYIYFNCETYPDTNCELWRIIGIVDGKVKLIRNESIGSYSWDTSASDINSGQGINEWSQADLMKLLNPGYESNNDLDNSGTSITVNNSLYYNSGSGTCYNGQSNATKSCDFTSTGLKNDTTRNMISDSTYYLGGWKSSSVYSNQAYEKERGTTVISSPSDGITRTTSWTGKIGLMYPSDYGYATDFTKCSQTLGSYDSSTDSYACRTNDWLYNSAVQWLLTPRSSDDNLAWVVYTSGFVHDGYNTHIANGVRPVLYLDSVLVIESGSGTESNPYRISA